MALNFKKAAQDAGVIQSGLLEGKTSTRLDQILMEPVTIIGVAPAVGKLEGRESRYPAIVVREYPNKFFKAGAGKVAQLIRAWADEAGCPFDPDADEAEFSCVHKNYDALTQELVEQGGVCVRFKMTHNDRTGRDYLDFDFVDD